MMELLEPTLQGMGYELVDIERSKGLIRVFIDSSKGITVEDCAAVSNQLARLFTVESIDYDRLEISSPGLDRALKKHSDFLRFQGERIHVKTRVPLNGRKNFAGVLRTVDESSIGLDVDGVLIKLDLSMLDKARLVPIV
jgi:ribosome maturation factor RimP